MCLCGLAWLYTSCWQFRPGNSFGLPVGLVSLSLNDCSNLSKVKNTNHRGCRQTIRTNTILERQTTGLPTTFALGATLVAPRDLAKSLEVLSLACLTNGLPPPEVTASLSDYVIVYGDED
jgi:hypothetical protein